MPEYQILELLLAAIISACDLPPVVTVKMPLIEELTRTLTLLNHPPFIVPGDFDDRPDAA